MRLSTLKRLSWIGAIVGTSASGYYANEMVQESLRAESVRVPKTKFEDPVISDLMAKDRLTSKQILDALYNIIHVPPPPVVEEAPAAVVYEAKEPPPPPVKLHLKFIAYDSSPERKHVAFIFDDSTKATRVFAEGDSVFNTGSKIAMIEKHRVVLLTKSGKKMELRIGRAEVKYYREETKMPPPRVARAKVVNTGKTNENSTDIDGFFLEGLNDLDKRALKYHTVPKKREIERDDDFGIDIVSYDDDENSDVKRRAISEKDLAKLENNKLRLMSQVLPEFAYNQDGSALGIKLAYLIDDPLLKKYGIRDGDILTHINDTPVKSEQDAMNIYNSMDRNTKRVRLRILREGKALFFMLEMDQFKNVPTTARKR